jgi:hypothetical protein
MSKKEGLAGFLEDFADNFTGDANKINDLIAVPIVIFTATAIAGYCVMPKGVFGIPRSAGKIQETEQNVEDLADNTPGAKKNDLAASNWLRFTLRRWSRGWSNRI